MARGTNKGKGSNPYGSGSSFNRARKQKQQAKAAFLNNLLRREEQTYIDNPELIVSDLMFIRAAENYTGEKFMPKEVDLNDPAVFAALVKSIEKSVRSQKEG